MRSSIARIGALVLLAACGSEPKPPPPPPRSPIKQQIDAQRRGIEAAQREMEAAQQRMNADAAAAAGTAPDSSAP